VAFDTQLSRLQAGIASTRVFSRLPVLFAQFTAGNMHDHLNGSSPLYGEEDAMESTESWHAMVHALAGERPHRGRVLRLEATGPGSRDEIGCYVRTAIEQHTTPKPGCVGVEQLAEIITTTVLNKLGAGYTLLRSDTDADVTEAALQGERRRRYGLRPRRLCRAGVGRRVRGLRCGCLAHRRLTDRSEARVGE
jgi:hypothetical protein